MKRFLQGVFVFFVFLLACSWRWDVPTAQAQSLFSYSEGRPPAADPGANRSPERQGKKDYLGAVKKFADIAMQHGRDTYGPKHSPLFVDGLSVTDYSPVRWPFQEAYAEEYNYPKEIISSNFAINQQLQITLRELTKVTGDKKYEQAARQAAEYALSHLQDKNGLLYWGHHATWDALHDEAVGLRSGAQRGAFTPPIYEMKTMVPDYHYLYEINPKVVKEDISQMVTTGTEDWRLLTIGRHMSYQTPRRNEWEKASLIDTSLNVPFTANANLNYWAYTLPHIQGGLAYYDLTGDERAWKLAYQMMKRHVNMRNPLTGLGPNTYVYDSEKWKPWMDFDLKRLSATSMKRYKFFPAIALKYAEILGPNTPKGIQLLEWGREELAAYARHLHVEGTAKRYGRLYLEGDVDDNTLYGTPPEVLWEIALAYRLTEDELMWNTARDIIKGYGLGNIGTLAGNGISVSAQPFELRPISRSWTDGRTRNRFNDMNAFVVHALVALYEATGRQPYIEMAENVADTLLEKLYDNGLFVRQKNGLYGRLGHMAPLALIHLVAAKQGKELEAWSVFPRWLYLRIPCGFEECVTTDKYWDSEVVYCRDKRTKVCEPTAADAQEADQTLEMQKGKLLYEAGMATPESVEDWRMEGPGKTRFQDGWMHMWSPGEQGHHVFWTPKTFPNRFIAEWEVQNLETDNGWAIVFFSAEGEHGKSIFHPSLPRRDGTYKQYTKGAIDNYGISYYGHVDFKPDRGYAALRKNTGFHLVQKGEEGIPSASRKIHKMRLVKDGPHIMMFVNDREIIDWKDRGKVGGPPHTSGKIGLRQMSWTHFRYRDFKVWALKSR